MFIRNVITILSKHISCYKCIFYESLFCLIRAPALWTHMFEHVGDAAHILANGVTLFHRSMCGINALIYSAHKQYPGKGK